MEELKKFKDKLKKMQEKQKKQENKTKKKSIFMFYLYSLFTCRAELDSLNLSLGWP